MKIKMLIWLFSVSLIMVVGCVQKTGNDDSVYRINESHPSPENYSKYPYDLGSLTIIFSSTYNNTLFANGFLENKSENHVFREYYSKELKETISESNKIEGLALLSWSTSDGSALVRLKYYEGTSNFDMNETLFKVKVELENRWYVRRIELSYKGDFN